METRANSRKHTTFICLLCIGPLIGFLPCYFVFVAGSICEERLSSNARQDCFSQNNIFGRELGCSGQCTNLSALLEMGHTCSVTD